MDYAVNISAAAYLFETENLLKEFFYILNSDFKNCVSHCNMYYAKKEAFWGSFWESKTYVENPANHKSW